MAQVAGIDFSSHVVDVVLVDEDSLAAVWHRVELSGRDAFERARSLRALPAVFDDCVAVGIEDPRGHNAGALYRVQGAVLAALPRGVLVQPWVPSAWRKAVGLPGNASKSVVALWVAAVRTMRHPPRLVPTGEPGCYAFDVEDWPQDACDAYCIALATLHAIERTEAA